MISKNWEIRTQRCQRCLPSQFWIWWPPRPPIWHILTLFSQGSDHPFRANCFDAICQEISRANFSPRFTRECNPCRVFQLLSSVALCGSVKNAATGLLDHQKIRMLPMLPAQDTRRRESFTSCERALASIKEGLCTTDGVGRRRSSCVLTMDEAKLISVPCNEDPGYLVWSGAWRPKSRFKNPARLDLKTVSDFFLPVLNFFHQQTFSCSARQQKPTSCQWQPVGSKFGTEAPAQSHKQRDHSPPRAMLWPAADAKPTTSPRPCLQSINPGRY